MKQEIIEEIKLSAGRYPHKRGALLNALTLLQRTEGEFAEKNIKLIERLLDVTPAEVAEVMTFYTLYKADGLAKYNFQVCRNVSCAILGSKNIVRHLEEKLNIKSGETSPDKMYSIEEVECLGCCDQAPAIRINDVYYGKLTEAKIDEILLSHR